MADSPAPELDLGRLREIAEDSLFRLHHGDRDVIRAAAQELQTLRAELARVSAARDAAQAQIYRWHQGDRDEFLRNLIGERDDMKQQALDAYRDERRARDEANEWASAIRTVARGAIPSPQAARAAISELFEKFERAQARAEQAERERDSALADLGTQHATCTHMLEAASLAADNLELTEQLGRAAQSRPAERKLVERALAWREKVAGPLTFDPKELRELIEAIDAVRAARAKDVDAAIENGLTCGELDDGGELELVLTVDGLTGSVYVSREFWAAVALRFDAGEDRSLWRSVYATLQAFHDAADERDGAG